MPGTRVRRRFRIAARVGLSWSRGRRAWAGHGDDREQLVFGADDGLELVGAAVDVDVALAGGLGEVDPLEAWGRGAAGGGRGGDDAAATFDQERRVL